MFGTKLMIFPDFLLMASELKGNIVFGEHVGLNLGIVLEPAGGTVEEPFFIIDDVEALLTDSVAAVEVARHLFIRIVEIITHGALHSQI